MRPPGMRTTPSGADLSLQHLQAELARIDVLIQRQVQRWQLAGQDPGDAFRGLYVSDDEVNGLLARPLGAAWAPDTAWQDCRPVAGQGKEGAEGT